MKHIIQSFFKMFLLCKYVAEAEIGFSAPAYMVTEGQNLSVCLQLSGGLQESVDVSVMAVDAVPLSAQGMYNRWVKGQCHTLSSLIRGTNSPFLQEEVWTTHFLIWS